MSKTHSKVSATQSEVSVATVMVAQPRTGWDYLARNLEEQPLCVTFPTTKAEGGSNFELKSGFIHQFPTFHGRLGEDPNKHFLAFHLICISMQSIGATENELKLRAFPFTLKDVVQDWLHYRPSWSTTIWLQMKKFL